jgi:hypothetical protein
MTIVDPFFFSVEREGLRSRHGRVVLTPTPQKRKINGESVEERNVIAMRLSPLTISDVFGISIVALILFCAPPAVKATTYTVDGTTVDIDDVPWKTLAAGDIVYIKYKSTAYKWKWIIARAGTRTLPIQIVGVPDTSTGALPIISGSGAKTPTVLDYDNETLGLIHVGTATIPDSTAAYIVIKNLEIVNADSDYTFKDDAGVSQDYDVRAAGIYVGAGSNVTISNCIFHGDGIGVRTCPDAMNVTIEYCHFYSNGESPYAYTPNIHTESDGVIIQGNYLEPLVSGCQSSNLIDRSAGVWIRYNWIEGGDRELELVDSTDSGLYNQSDYDDAFVYGNVIYEPSDGYGTNEIVRFGGEDSGTSAYYRTGILYFGNNTVVSKHYSDITVFTLSSSDGICKAWNNVFYTNRGGSYLGILGAKGTVNLQYNWLNKNWVDTHVSGSSYTGTVNEIAGNIVDNSGALFVAMASNDFHLAKNSQCIDKGRDILDILPGTEVLDYEYVPDATLQSRRTDSTLDIGAFEYDPNLSARPESWFFLR